MFDLWVRDNLVTRRKNKVVPYQFDCFRALINIVGSRRVMSCVMSARVHFGAVYGICISFSFC